MSSNPGAYDSAFGTTPNDTGENRIPDDPTAQLGFEIVPTAEWWTFAPTYYPDQFRQTKDRDLNRNGRQCRGEDVSLKAIKNREFHATGVVLASEVPILQRLIDYGDVVDLISPITPDGGMECHIKNAELGEKRGYDPIERMWMFKYSIDLVSTGADEYDTGQNAIVTAIADPPESTANEPEGILEQLAAEFEEASENTEELLSGG